MSYRNGVEYYTTGRVTVNIHFPEDKVKCFHCWMCYKDSLGRNICRLMEREVYHIDRGIHEDCPLIFEEEENEEIPNTDGG